MTRAALSPGTVIAGKYRVEREIGAGGMGVVALAQHVELDQRVAIKVLNPDIASDADTVERFMREARIAATLDTEHVARVSDVGRTEWGAPFLVMELLKGSDLAQVIETRGRIPLNEAVDLLLEACEGVAVAHAAGLVHRDLKPANLFLARRNHKRPIVKVLDFGLSKGPRDARLESITRVGDIFGTPQYMSPEQARSTKFVDGRSDQHALAAILFEMVSGAPVYDVPNLTDLLIAIATAPPPHIRDRMPELPNALDLALVRALAKSPGDRFPDVAAFAAAIAPFGGPGAAQAASDVFSALNPRVISAPAPVRTNLSPADESDASGDSTTRRLDGPRDVGSRPNLAISTDPAKLRARRRRLHTFAALGALGIGGALAFGFRSAIVESSSVGASAPQPTAAATPLSATASPSDESSARLPPTAASASGASAATASAVPVKSASRSEPKRQPRPAETRSSASPPRESAPKSVVKVFGEP